MSHLSWLKIDDVSGTITALMMGTEMVPEILEIFNQLT
jgi:hypothetical protein